MRRRSALTERAAAIFAQRSTRRPRSWLDEALLAEIERALGTQQRDVLAALDRLREKADLPQDSRVARELKIEQLKNEIFSPRKGTAA